MDLDGAAAGGAQGRGGAASSSMPRFADPRLQQLEAAIDRVRTNNRPILLARPAPSAEQQQQNGTGSTMCVLRVEARPGLNTGLDPALLGAFRPVVHRWAERVAGWWVQQPVRCQYCCSNLECLDFEVRRTLLMRRVSRSSCMTRLLGEGPVSPGVESAVR